MIFHPLPVEGAWRIEIERFEDERGFFARTFCEREFGDHGLETRWVQSSVSFNLHRGTLRGMHWQAAPHEETKLVRCTAGRLWDVLLDLRPGSATYRQHAAGELTAAGHAMFFVPKGVAHGFLTLEDDTEVSYQMSAHFHPDAGRGLRWNDPAFDLPWPESPVVLSERDAGYPDFRPEQVQR